MKTDEYRLLTGEEKRALLRILSGDFNGKSSLVAQLDTLRIRPIDATLFALCREEAAERETKSLLHPIPNEASYRDKDGVLVFADLFVNDRGELAELEIWKGDGTPVLTSYTDADLLVGPRSKIGD